MESDNYFQFDVLFSFYRYIDTKQARLNNCLYFNPDKKYIKFLFVFRSIFESVFE